MKAGAELELENVTCALCGMDNYTCLFNGRDYRFGRKEEYKVVKCNNCGLIYINPRPTAKFISKLYEEDYTPENNPNVLPKIETSQWKIILKKTWHKINGQYWHEIISNAKGRVLDIGCGNGYILLQLKHKGHEVYGVETNHKSVEICRKLGLEVFCGTLEDAKFPDAFFDTIVMSQVLEHISSPKESLKEVYRILKPGGNVFIYCPNGESYISKLFGKYWHGWHIPFHFYTFTKDTLKKVSIEIGFKLKKISTTTPDHFFVVSLKGYLFGEKSDSIRPIDRGKFFDSLFFRFIVSPIFRALDFLTQNGDCLKVKLEK